MGEMGSVAAAVVLLFISQLCAHPSIEGNKESLKEVFEEGLKTDFVATDDQTEGIEAVPYSVLNTNNDYEKRLYPPMTMACSDMTYNVTEEDGGEESDENGSMYNVMKMYRRMASKLWIKKPSRQMFMKLFRYINGLNQEAVEIDMTSPVISVVTPLAKNRMHKQMCFYLGQKYKMVDPPKPRDVEVRIIKKEKFSVYVHKFGGYAMKDAVWINESEKLKVKLAAVEDITDVDFSNFLAAGYDSPMKFWNRRNEVIFTVGLTNKAVEDALNKNTAEDAIEKEGKSVEDESLSSFNEDSLILSMIGQPYKGILDDKLSQTNAENDETKIESKLITPETSAIKDSDGM